jgi:hypothetical protein
MMESGKFLSPEQMKAKGVVNVGFTDLPVAPRVRSRATGEIHVWDPVFASRPDLFECCDESGRTEESAWRGRGPGGQTLGEPGSGPPPPKLSDHPVFADNVVGRREAPGEPVPGVFLPPSV